MIVKHAAVLDSSDIPVYLFLTNDEEMQKSINIEYGFSAVRVRNNKVRSKTYGSSGLTYDTLFNYLERKYRKAVVGESDFIQEYFRIVYPRYAKYVVEGELEGLTKAIRETIKENKALLQGLHYTKSNRLNRRYSSTKLIEQGVMTVDSYLMSKLGIEKEMKVFNKQTFNSIAKFIKGDIIKSLRNGSIPMHYVLSKKTLERRRELSIQSMEVFYATGRFIKSIHIYFGIGVSG